MVRNEGWEPFAVEHSIADRAVNVAGTPDIVLKNNSDEYMIFHRKRCSGTLPSKLQGVATPSKGLSAQQQALHSKLMNDCSNDMQCNTRIELECQSMFTHEKQLHQAETNGLQGSRMRRAILQAFLYAGLWHENGRGLVTEIRIALLHDKRRQPKVCHTSEKIAYAIMIQNIELVHTVGIKNAM
jgi:hypothetical protein